MSEKMKGRENWRDEGFEAVQRMLQALGFIKKPDPKNLIIDFMKAYEDHYGKRMSRPDLQHYYETLDEDAKIK